MQRRDWLKSAGMALAATGIDSRLSAEEAGKRRLFSAMGIAAPLAQAETLKGQGAEFLTLGTGDFLVPDQSDEVFAANLAKLKAAALPMLACNGFIRPANLRCVGPEANHEEILKWAETAFRRLHEAGGRFMVFGSAGARKIPDGWSREKADEQFVDFLKKLGPIAEKQQVIVTVEQLQASECNYINRLAEGAALIRKAGHPNVRLLADLFHMAVMGDTPQDLKAAMDVVVHMEIAEKVGRTYPGTQGDDFRPYFKVLRESGYQGAISIEGKGDPGNSAKAFETIAGQAADV